MPLTLVTGPANAEKAGRRPGRLPRGARPRAAARRARRRPTSSATGASSPAAGAVFGVRGPALRLARCARSRGAPACAGGRSARWRASASRRRGRRDRGSSALAPLGRHARLRCARCSALVDELEERADRAGRWYAALRAWAAAAPAQRGLRRGARRRCTAPTATASSASGAATRGCTRVAALDALRLRARALGRHARVPLRLRRPHAAPARRRRDARRPLRRRRHACR